MQTLKFYESFFACSGLRWERRWDGAARGAYTKKSHNKNNNGNWNSETTGTVNQDGSIVGGASRDAKSR